MEGVKEELLDFILDEWDESVCSSINAEGFLKIEEKFRKIGTTLRLATGLDESESYCRLYALFHRMYDDDDYTETLDCMLKKILSIICTDHRRWMDVHEYYIEDKIKVREMKCKHCSLSRRIF